MIEPFHIVVSIWPEGHVAHFRTTELYQPGDCVIRWVNEGSILMRDVAARAALEAQP